MDPSDGGAAHPNSIAAQKQPGCDVKPRLTKDQHDVLEHHFSQQHKPSTNVKKEFATKLGVPLDKINNWFQNRRAKVKQDRKKAMNQMTMGVGLPFGQHMAGLPTHFGHQEHSRPQHSQHPQHPQHPHHAPHPQYPQHPHAQMPMHSEYYSGASDVNSAHLPVQSVETGAPLDMAGQVSMQAQFDLLHSLRSIPEANRSSAYHPDALMHNIMAATNGACMQNLDMSTNAQNSAYAYDSAGLPSTFANDMTFVGPTGQTEMAPSHPAFAFSDFGLDYSTLTATNTNHSGSADLQPSLGSISSEASPFSGPQSGRATQSPSGPTPASVASVTSLYTGWTEDQTQLAQTKQEDTTEDQFHNPYNLVQASSSEHALPLWGQGRQDQTFAQSNFCQQTNASAHAMLSSPRQANLRTHSATPSEYDYPPVFHENGYTRRNSSASNLVTNMDSIRIRNGTPDSVNSAIQASSIAARRQKQPIALSSTAMRSASYSAPMPSPGGNQDHTLRRIRSSGIGNVGRVQKSKPNSAQPSPMASTFAEAASSPKFARNFSSSSTTTINQGRGSLAPPTPLTPQDFGNYWQNNTVIKPHSVMPEHNSPESMHTNWSADPQAGNVIANNASPSLSCSKLQSQLNEAMYRDSPPQSAPPTQQTFLRSSYMQHPHMRAGFHSTTDLTQQLKPSHSRRPSLPNSAQGQVENSLQYLQAADLSYDDLNDISLNGIHHNVPFAPPLSAMPDFLVHQYNPPPGLDAHGNPIRRMGESQHKSFTFANQGPSDFRTQ